MKAGRKRKPDAPRKRGRIDWRAEREDPTLTAVWNRARDVFASVGRQPRHATQAGKLHFFRQLTDLEMDAVERWCEMLETYHRVVRSHTGAIRPSALERIGVSLGSDWDDDQVRIFRARFDAAQGQILRLAGREALAALNRLCRDEAAASVLPDAKKGLAALIDHFGLKPAKQA